jgi:hypothetical protein
MLVNFIPSEFGEFDASPPSYFLILSLRLFPRSFSLVLDLALLSKYIWPKRG